MKKLLKSAVCGSCEQCTRPTDMLKKVEKSNCAATVHEQCMNSSRNSDSSLKRVPKKNARCKRQTPNPNVA